MTHPSVPVLVEPLDEGGRYVVLAPTPAFVLENRVIGESVSSAFSSHGRVALARVLGRDYDWVLPKGVSGIVTKTLIDEGRQAVGFRTPLLEIGPSEASVPHHEDSLAQAQNAEADALKIKSPTHGIFYRRQDPESEAFVELDQVVEKGHILGLVEVMKTFHQIRLDGEGLPSRVRIVSIVAEDASEVEPGQTLFVVETVIGDK